MTHDQFVNALMGHAMRFENNNRNQVATIDGVPVKVGDVVCFKSDFEQCGTVTAIDGNRLTIRSNCSSGFGGDYLQGDMTTVELASDCWIE